MDELKDVILCGICGELEVLDDGAGVSFRQYTHRDARFTLLACRPCMTNVERVQCEIDATTAVVARNLRYAIINGAADPVAVTIEAARMRAMEARGVEKTSNERRSNLIVLQGGLAADKGGE